MERSAPGGCKRRRLTAGTPSHRLLAYLHEEYGCSNTHVYIGKSSLGGNGLFLDENVERNTKILTIPLQLLITEELALNSDVGRAVKETFGDNIPGRIILILYLLHIKHAVASDPTRESRWAEYIDSLPRMYSTPVFLANQGEDDRTLSRLEGTAVGAREYRRLEQMKSTYTALFPTLSRMHPLLFAECAYTWDAYLWGHTTVATRLFPPTFSIPNNQNAETVPDGPGGRSRRPTVVPGGCLIPCADMLNHQAGSRLKWSTDNLCLYAHSTRNMERGEEIVFSYGDEKSNGHLLVTYGFTTPFNTHDVVPLNFLPLGTPWLSTYHEDGTVPNRLSEIGKRLGLAPVVASCKCSGSPVEISRSLLMTTARLYSSKNIREACAVEEFAQVLSVQLEEQAVIYAKKIVDTAMSKMQNLSAFDSIDGDARFESFGKHDSITWYLHGQLQSLRHTMALLNVHAGTLQDTRKGLERTGSFSIHRTHMRMALEQARYALRVGEVPVGCVFVREGVIVATGHNKTNVTCNATRHAELVAYDKSFVASGQNPKVLENSTLYVTVEPCIMCAAALRACGVKAVFFGCRNDKFGGNGSVLSLHKTGATGFTATSQGYVVTGGILEQEAIHMLQSFYERGNTKAPKPQRKVAKVC